MKINIIDENSLNIEGLTKRQIALIEESIYHMWYEHGDYQTNINELKYMSNEFSNVGIKNIFNLQEERDNIRKDIDEIMKNVKK